MYFPRDESRILSLSLFLACFSAVETREVRFHALIRSFELGFLPSFQLAKLSCLRPPGNNIE